MNAATLVLILASNQGYWFGGQAGSMEIRWAVRGGLPPANLSWSLALGDVSLASGQVEMPDGERAGTVHIDVPEVRVRTRLQWVYRVTLRQDGREIERGQVPVHLFPVDPLNGLAERLEDRKLVVLDAPSSLSRTLERAKVLHTRIEDLSALQVVRADLLLVGPDRIGEALLEQAPLIEQARAGAGVFLFAQPRARRIAGFATAERALPRELNWRMEHPLFEGLEPADVRSWLAGRQTLRAAQLPADEAALEVAFWAPELAGQVPAPIDALVVSKSIGRGRIVLFQIPLGDFEQDPRSQIALVNALEYLRTRPEPTPPPGQRRGAEPKGPASMPNLLLGGRP